jgi:hypothetical protein
MPPRPACSSLLLALLGLVLAAGLQAGACSSNPDPVAAAPDAGGGPEVGTPAFLTPAAVTGLPRGNAVGKAFVATLQSQTSALDACTCRAGNCTAFPSLPFILALKADNGAIEMMSIRGGGRFPPCAGGADADGRFWCGAVDSQGGLHLTSGQITWAADGTIASVHLTKKESGRGSDGYGEPLDCDVTESATFTSI